MKMFILIYREFMNEEVHSILDRMDIKAYTEVPKVFGMGELGRVEDTRYGPGHNSCIFAALSDDEARRAVHAFEEYAEMNKREYGRPTALRAFVMPCEQML